MFCFQCQETAKNTGCTVKGVCGKPEGTANLQDLLIFVLKGIAVYEEKLKELGAADRSNKLGIVTCPLKGDSIRPEPATSTDATTSCSVSYPMTATSASSTSGFFAWDEKPGRSRSRR